MACGSGPLGRSAAEDCNRRDLPANGSEEKKYLTRTLQRARSTIINMSSLSRRACYKCGNVGHYAEVCTSSERLCYNCKQPGHESNQCPHPRTTESTSDGVVKEEGTWQLTCRQRSNATIVKDLVTSRLTVPPSALAAAQLAVAVIHAVKSATSRGIAQLRIQRQRPVAAAVATAVSEEGTV